MKNYVATESADGGTKIVKVADTRKKAETAIIKRINNMLKEHAYCEDTEFTPTTSYKDALEKARQLDDEIEYEIRIK